MNPPPKNRPLSIEFLGEALKEALNEPHDVPYDRIIMNEERWRSVFEGSDVRFEHNGKEFIYGVNMKLIHPGDMKATMEAVFHGNLGFSDHSVFLLPEQQYDQKLMLELDFGFETTREVEKLLQSGDVVITPCDSGYQYLYTVDVSKNEAHKALGRLVTGNEYHGFWQLRGDISVQVRDGDITIVGRSCRNGDPNRELAAELVRRYNVKVDTTKLRKQVKRLLDEALRLEVRADCLEKLTK